MALYTRELDISCMKKSDFKQLEEIFDYVVQEEVYWGNKRYFDQRNQRIKSWLEQVNKRLEGEEIGCPKRSDR